MSFASFFFNVLHIYILPLSISVIWRRIDHHFLFLKRRQIFLSGCINFLMLNETVQQVGIINADSVLSVKKELFTDIRVFDSMSSGMFAIRVVAQRCRDFFLLLQIASLNFVCIWKSFSIRMAHWKRVYLRKSQLSTWPVQVCKDDEVVLKCVLPVPVLLLQIGAFAFFFLLAFNFNSGLQMYIPLSYFLHLSSNGMTCFF